jgi:hypothetical protein
MDGNGRRIRFGAWTDGAGVARRGVLTLSVSVLCFGAIAVGASHEALAETTPVTLYVDGANGQSTSECASPGSGACQTVQEGISAAEKLVNSSVTLNVAGAGGFFGQQTYVETGGDTIAVPASDTLTIQGVGNPIVTTNGNGTVFTINGSTGIAGAPRVIVDGLTVQHGSGGTGAGFTVNGDIALLSGDTIINNNSFGSGGALYNQSFNTVTLTNDTIANNTAMLAGSAILTLEGNTVLIDDTLFNNTGAPGIDFGGMGTVTISDSILDATSCNPNQATLATIDGGHNVESDNSCHFGSTDVVNSSTINLAPALAANGSTGPQTYAIGSDSSAFERVPLLACSVPTDERGAARPGVPGQNCDAGAFEFQGPPPAPPTVDVTTVSGVGSTTAALGAFVNPGGADTTVTATCSGGAFTASTQDVGAGSSTVASSVNLTGLTPDTPYSCSITATNGAGSATSGTPATFTTSSAPAQTAPSVGATSGSAQSSTTAALAAPVNPGAADTTVTATCTGGTFTASTQDIGSGTSPVASSVSLTGLSAGTAYSCTITAANSVGTAISTTRVAFTTPPAPPPPPAGATTSASATSASPSGTASATSGGVTVTATGEGAFTIAQYKSPPAGAPHTFRSSGAYFDVHVAPGSSFTSLTIVDSNLGGATSLYWWNGSTWSKVSPETSPSGSPPTITATLSATSTPTIAQLTGTIFTPGTAPPNTVLVKSQVNVRKHRATLSFRATGPARGFQCALVGPSRGKHTAKPVYRACRSPRAYKHLKSGRYTFYVRATGPGGTDPTPAHAGFRIS